MSLIRKFAGQAVVYGIGSILSKIVYYLIVVVLLTHMLGDQTEEFGIYGYLYAYAGLLLSLFSFRLDSALFRFGNKNEGEQMSQALGTSFFAVLVSAVVLVIIGVFCSSAISDWYGYPMTPRYVRWFAFILAFDVMNLIPFAQLRLDDKALKFAGFRIFNVVLSTTLILFFLVALPRLPEDSLGFLSRSRSIIDWVFIANLIASGVLFLLLLPELLRHKFSFNTKLFRKMVRYALPLVIVGVAGGFIQFFAVPLQEMFLGGSEQDNLAEAGVYDLTRKIAGLFLMFVTAFNYAAEPFFFNNSNVSDREQYYGKICRLFVLTGGLVVIGMFYAVDLLKHLSTSDYWDSLSLLPILLMSYLLLGIYYNVSIWYKLSDNTKYGAIISIVGVIITLAISVVFLSRIGYAASAWASLASYFVMVILGYAIGQKIYPIRYPIAKIARDLIIISVLLVIGVLIRTHTPDPLKYVANIILLLVYVAYAYTSEREEWQKVLRRSA